METQNEGSITGFAKALTVSGLLTESDNKISEMKRLSAKDRSELRAALIAEGFRFDLIG